MTDNVALLPMLAGMPNGQAGRALELLTALDVHHRAKAMPVSAVWWRTAACGHCGGWSIGPR